MEMFDRIKKVRKDNNLSQSDFAEKLGVTRSVISNIELNRLAKPNQKTSLIKLISKEFNVNEQWLLNGVGEPYIITSDDDKFAEALADLTESTNVEIKEIIQKMVKLRDERYINLILHLVNTLYEDSKK